jgi:hypothetical protein
MNKNVAMDFNGAQDQEWLLAKASCILLLCIT